MRPRREAYGALHPRVWGPKRAGGRGEMATGAVGPGTCISPAWSAHPLTAQGVRPISPRPPSLFGPSVPRPCPTDCLLLPPLWGGRGRCAPCRCAPCPAVPAGHPPPAPSEWPFGAVRPPGCPYGTSSSLPFGVAVRCCAPPVLALWATSSSHVPWAVPVLVLRTASSSLPFGVAVVPVWPCGPSSSLAVLRPSGRCAPPSLPYGLRPPPPLRSGRLVPGVPPVPQVKVKHHGGSRHPWAEVRSGRGKRGHQYYGVTPS